jgi:hypothetical protein
MDAIPANQAHMVVRLNRAMRRLDELIGVHQAERDSTG